MIKKIVVLFLGAISCAAQSLTLTPFHANGIYNPGEKVGWTVKPKEGTTAPAGDYTYTIKKNNWDNLSSGGFKLSVGRESATIAVKVDEPAMIYLDIKPPEGGKAIVAGAAVAPTQLQPTSPRPDDFDAFWNFKIKMLESVPPNPVLESKDGGKPDVDYFTITMDNVEGKHIHGQMAKPKGDGKYPALVIFQWASPPYPLQKAWVTDRAAQGWLALNVEPHDVLPDQPKSYYDALPPELKHYEGVERKNRDKNYFLYMYLGDYRAIDYIMSRPDWDGKTLVVMGTSMGGQQSLCMAGLHSGITDLIVNEPAGCDVQAPLHHRAAAYPNWPSNDPQIMATAIYFDPVNFASHIKAKCMVAMGFVDTTAQPAGIWTAFNQIQGPKEAVPMIDSPHNHLATGAQQRPFNTRSAEWLESLVKTGDVEVK